MTNATVERTTATTRARRFGDDLDIEWLRALGAGSMRIRVGDGDVLVRVDGDVLEVQAPVLVGMAHSEALTRHLADLSDTLPAATLSWVAGHVVVSTDLPVAFLDQDLLLEACITIRNVAAHFRARIEHDFGGR
jgi:hypothetical protein